MADVSVSGFRKYWTRKLESLYYQCHAITNKYQEAGSVVETV
jgi:arabinogalactan endo-1,4-beta-galactosidase